MIILNNHFQHAQYTLTLISDVSSLSEAKERTNSRDIKHTKSCNRTNRYKSSRANGRQFRN